MATLTVLSGFSGSGKTTAADALFAQQACCFLLRSDNYHHCYCPGQDVTQFLIDVALAHLQNGIDVIVDAVNRHPSDRPRWAAAAKRSDCEMHWVNLDVPLAICIARDALRPTPVGREVILAQALGDADLTSPAR